MGELRLQLLGPPRISHDGVAVTFQRRRSLALLAYLALSARPATRDSLAFLLAGDVPDEQARKHLRNALTDVRNLIGEHLVVTPQTVAFNRGEPFWLDVEELERAARTADALGIEALESVLALYEDELLAGLDIRDAPAFEEWRERERERIRPLVVHVAAQLVTRYEERRELPAAIAIARRLLALEPWNEAGHRQLIRLLARDGQRTAALAQYATCRRILADELGAEPEPETEALYRRLQQTPATPPHTLPTAVTTLVGRERELAVLRLRLADPTFRVVTILGLGGSGKTRLAIEVARGFATPPAALDEHPFADGIFFVSLAEVHGQIAQRAGQAEPARIVQAMAVTIGQALGLAFPGSVDPLQHLAAFLGTKALLLILDNFESVIDGADVLATLTGRAPRVTILVTSRVRLGLAEESVLELGGLACPTDLDDVEHADASRLFLDQAERLQLDATLSSEDRTAIVRICALVEGLPLAVRLAATWRRGLSCTAIATELERGIDLLATTERGISPRHRSMRACLATTWRQLSEAERRIVRELSVFRGGFSMEAGQAVVGLEGRDLLRLRDRALVTTGGEQRYVLHELVRQYAAKQLAAWPEEEEETRRRHAEYFARLMHSNESELYKSPEARAVLGLDLANVRLAWAWMIAHRAYTLLGIAQQGLGIWYELSGPYREWEEVFGAAERSVRAGLAEPANPQPDVREVLGTLLVNRTRALGLLGNLDVAGTMLDEAQELARAAGAQGLEAVVAFNRLQPLLRRGNFRAAQEAGEDALARARAVDLPRLQALTLVYLADFAKELGAFTQAEAFLDRASRTFRDLHDQQGDARVANNRGRIELERGRYDEVYAHANQALHSARALGYRAGEMFALLTLGRINDDGYGRSLDAKVHLTQSLQIAQELGDRYSGASIHTALGRNALSRGDFDFARAEIAEAFEIFSRFRDRAYGGEVIQLMGRLAHYCDDDERARVLAQQALDAAGETGHFRTRRLALRLLGHALFALGEYIDAGVAYWDARELEQRIENPSLEVDTLAGLARVALAQEQTDRAAEHVASILDTLAERGAGGIEEPVRVYLTCHAVLRARRDLSAAAVLADGHALLLERAAQFADPEERRMFVDELPAHRELLREWQRTHGAEADRLQGLQHAG